MESQPINDGFRIRILALFFYKIFSQKYIRRCRKSPGGILFVSSRLCIKTWAEAGLAEARAMQFVSQNTWIPVPKVHAAFSHKGYTYILMERIRATVSLKNGPSARRIKSTDTCPAEVFCGAAAEHPTTRRRWHCKCRWRADLRLAPSETIILGSFPDDPRLPPGTPIRDRHHKFR